MLNDMGLRLARRGILFAAAAFTVVASPAHADPVQDAGGWIIASKTGDFKALSPKLTRLKYWFDSQVRLLEDADGYNQSIVRPALGWRIFDNSAVWLGYNWLHTSIPGKRSTNEHQVWEQFTWFDPGGSFTRYWRTRLEQRFRTDSDDPGLRLRQLLKATLPLRTGSAFSIATYDEVFFHLKDTDWGLDAGFGQNRFFIGVAWKVAPKLGATIEFGYLNQYIHKATGPNRLNHLVTLTFAFK